MFFLLVISMYDFYTVCVLGNAVRFNFAIFRLYATSFAFPAFGANALVTRVDLFAFAVIAFVFTLARLDFAKLAQKA